jgi:hypothetical protein
MFAIDNLRKSYFLFTAKGQYDGIGESSKRRGRELTRTKNVSSHAPSVRAACGLLTQGVAEPPPWADEFRAFAALKPHDPDS